MIFDKFIRVLCLFGFLLSVEIKSDDFIYSLRLGESLDSIRGKLNINFSTTDEYGWTIVNDNNIPGGPRYISQTDLIFFDKELVGTIFSINPSISEFSSYEERNKFMINSFSVLSKKFDKKYRTNDPESNNYVRCGGTKTYDYSTCIGQKEFFNRTKNIRIVFSSGSITQYISWKKRFDDLDDMLTNMGISIMTTYLESIQQNMEVKKRMLEKKGVKFEKKSYDLASAEAEIAFSETP